MRVVGLIVLFLFAACWSGSDGSDGSGGGDALPVTATVAFPDAPSGIVALEVTLTDPEGLPVALAVECTYDGSTWRPLSLAPAIDLTSVATAVVGRTITLPWDSVADLGFRTTSAARLRVTASRDDGIAAPVVVEVPALDNLRAAAMRVQHPMVHYGPIDAGTMELAKQHDLVVVHPSSGGLDAATIRELQLGRDPFDPADDVIVLAYISVGEDLRTVGLTDSQMLLDPRFVGDATGPRIDPRGPNADGQPLTGLPPLGSVTNSPTGPRFASWYLDDNSVDRSPTDTGDGLPDRNSAFGGCFVNAGDPQWFEVLDAMELDGVDAQPGMRELLTVDHGRGFSCDGLFYDTFDTCAPNYYTDSSSFNQSEFEWTAPGFLAFTQRFKARYPDKLALQNRGMFFFDPRIPHYAATTREHVDLVLVESYRLDSSHAHQYHAYFSADNKHNFAPKLLAEAGRPDGFRVLSLGYAEGPGIEHGTLLGQSMVGFSTLVEDVVEAQLTAGFAHYLTDAGVALPNRFAMDQVTPDARAPVWSSTYNDNILPFPTPAIAPTPRVGLQRVTAGDQSVTVHWDVAQDQSRVGYALYVQDSPFDFLADPSLTAAERRVLTPGVGGGYAQGIGPAVYPFEATIDGLTNGQSYWLCLRAFDALGHEEQNRVTLTALPRQPIVIDGVFDDWAGTPTLLLDPDDVPDSAGPDWLDIAVQNDEASVYLRFRSANAFNLDGSPAYPFSRTLIFFDLDDNAATGWSIGGIGSDLLLAGDELFTQSAAVFNTGSLGLVQAAPRVNVTECEIAIPWSAIDGIAPSAARLRLVFVNDEVNDYAPGGGHVIYDAIR
ncbi:MAG: hypothetical protein NXI31_14925 [bacterium]|nr:hypothetical protein [bacterium]